jgi:hypothetical protein
VREAVDDRQDKGGVRRVVEPKGRKYNVNPPQGKVLDRTRQQKLYFYVDGKLYKTIRNDRAADLCRSWGFIENRVVDFPLSIVRRQSQQAFDTAEVCKLLNRTKQNIFLHLRRGAINLPYKIGVNGTGDPRIEFGLFKWSEDDVLALHEHYLTVGSGRPRKDGVIYSAARIPSRLELIAMMKQNKMYYVQDASGNFVPIFDQPDWT